MTSNNLGNLAKIGQLKHEPPAKSEMDERLLAELIAITGKLLNAVEKLGPVKA